MTSTTPEQQRKELRASGFLLGRKGWIIPKTYNGEHHQLDKDYPYTISRNGAYQVLQAMKAKNGSNISK